MAVPVPSHPAVTTPFGKPGSWAAGFHTGDDYGSPGIHGAAVVATRSGTVVYAGANGGWGPAYGSHVIIDSGGVRHMYAHLSSIAVSYGQRMGEGDKVGTVGNTGRSFGPHLHYEERTSPYRYGADARDPSFSRGGGAAQTSSVRAATPPAFGAYCYGKRRRAHRALQRRLADKGHDPGFGDWPTTYYGDGTKAAVAAFQQAQGWSGADADGLLGPATLDRLGLPKRWSFRDDKIVHSSAMQMDAADSDSVWNVQVALMLRGYSIPAGPTDFFGKQTRTAVRQFQSDKKRGDAPPSGIPDAETVAALGLVWVDDAAVVDEPDEDSEADETPSVTVQAPGDRTRLPGATWDPVEGFPGLRPFARGGGPKIVLHTTESDAKPDWKGLGSGIPHVTVDLEQDVVWQHLPLDVAAYTLMGGEHSPNSGAGVTIQVEVVGHAHESPSWSSARYDRLRHLIHSIATAIGAPEVLPFRFCGSDGFGAGGAVRQPWDQYRDASGIVGHAHVPYNDHWDPGLLDASRILQRQGQASSTPSEPVPVQDAEVPVITFNVPRRYDSGGTLSDTSLLSGLMADCAVLGLQEAGWARELVDSLGWTVHQPTDSSGKPVAQLLVWNPAVWETVDVGATLLSPETKVQPQAAGPTKHREKHIVWADLRHTVTSQVWNMAVVHFVPSKHLGGAARALWIEQRDALIAWLGRQGPRAVVLGDFNAQPQDPLAAPLREVAKVDSAVSHGRRRIDWIVRKPSVTAVGSAVALDNRGQSDHKPVRGLLTG